MPPLRLLVRTALRFHGLLQSQRDRAVRADQALLGRLADGQRRLDCLRALAELARGRGWRAAAQRLMGDLRAQIRAVREAADQALSAGGRPVPQAPDLRTLVEELLQLGREFGGLQIDFRDRAVEVTTEPGVLEGVPLGPFAVRLPWTRLAGGAGSDWFTVVALDPNPAAADGAVTHPHVRRGRLCAGAATGAVRLALEQGRLADAFLLVRGVLTHYHPVGAHVPRDEWRGVGCHDCGDRGVGCHDCGRCGDRYCAECSRGCPACGADRCYGCLDRCPRCAGRYCADCLTRSASPGRACCPGCSQACSASGAAGAGDELDPDTRQCPPGRAGQTSPDPPPPPGRASTETLHGTP